MRIVFTRRPAQAGSMEAAAEAAGHRITFMPLTIHELPEDIGELIRAVEHLEAGCFDWLLLTSANTVRALTQSGWSGRLPSRTRLGAVGPGTARVLEELTGLSDPWTPQDYSAAGILAELTVPAAGERMLLPQSAQARSDLAEGLRARGWQLTHVAAYRTVPAHRPALPQPATGQRLQVPAVAEAESAELLEPEGLRDDDVVLLTSSTAAEAYAQLRLRRSPTLVAIGEPTAATMRKQGLSVAAVMGSPTAAGLIAALKDPGVAPSAQSLDWEPDAQITPGGD